MTNGDPSDLLVFLLHAVVISLSGVMAPGPITAAVVAAGADRRHAGALMALGHGAVEFPLMLLILRWADTLIESPGARIGIGLAGGAFLVLSGWQMLMAMGRANGAAGHARQQRPFWTGAILSSANPYFLMWWATIGLALTVQAAEFGVAAFAVFAVVHWLCDLVWLEALSLASFKGSKLLGEHSQTVVLVICGIALVGFGGRFIFDAAAALGAR